VAARLHYKNICAAHILENLKVNLAVAEAAQQRLAEVHVEIPANALGQHRIRSARKNLESLVVHEELSPLLRATRKISATGV
jgi:hypothetical protein